MIFTLFFSFFSQQPFPPWHNILQNIIPVPHLIIFPASIFFISFPFGPCLQGGKDPGEGVSLSPKWENFWFLNLSKSFFRPLYNNFYPSFSTYSVFFFSQQPSPPHLIFAKYYTCSLILLFPHILLFYIFSLWALSAGGIGSRGRGVPFTWVRKFLIFEPL